MTGTVLTDDANGVRTLTLNRPERLNALNDELLADFAAALDAAASDDSVRVILLRGAGRAFCAGDDLKDFADQTGGEAIARTYVDAIQVITRHLVLGEKMVVGAIHGWAVGGGFEWVIDCDLAVLAQSTRCFFPEITWGLFPTGAATALLPRAVGLPKAREMFLFGEKYTAAQLVEMGLAWKTVADDAVFDEAAAAASRIAELPRGAVRDLKRVLNRTGGLDVEGAIALETDATVRAFLDPEAAERVKEFTRYKKGPVSRPD